MLDKQAHSYQLETLSPSITRLLDRNECPQSVLVEELSDDLVI
jgi:hypothetical protein